MAKVKFPKGELLDLLWEDETDFGKVVHNELVDTSRWSNVYSLVFQKDEKFYETSYQTGATEQQDETPWEYDGPEIECWEVKPVPKTIVVYEPVK